MKKILNLIKLNFITFIKSAWYAIIAVLIGVVIGIICGFQIGFLTFFTICSTIVLFVWLRQLYWWITKTGDYK